MRNIYVVKAKLATCGLLKCIRSKTENSRNTLRNTCPSIHQWYPKTLYLIMDSREVTSSTKRLFFSSRGTQTMDAKAVNDRKVIPRAYTFFSLNSTCVANT